MTVPAPLQIKVDEPPTRGSSSYREVDVVPGRFKATHRSHAPARSMLTLFALVWNCFIAAALVMDWRGFLGAGFTLLHLAVGLGLAWYVLAAWLNSSVIVIKDGVLARTTGPIPMLNWFRKTQGVPLELVDTFRVEKRVWGKVNGKPEYQFFVVAEVRGGETATVTDGLPTREAATFLQKRFERHCGTSDDDPKTRVHDELVEEEVVEEELAERTLD